MVNIIVGGRIEWKTTYKLRITSYRCLSRMDHSFPQKVIEDGSIVHKQPDEFNA